MFKIELYKKQKRTNEKHAKIVGYKWEKMKPEKFQLQLFSAAFQKRRKQNHNKQQYHI